MGGLAAPAAVLIQSMGGDRMKGTEAGFRLLLECLLISGVLAILIPLAGYAYGRMGKTSAPRPGLAIIGFSAFGWIAGAALANALRAP
ncbi:hypothetical protein BH09PSE2_BH09PSE2_23590 [soil metagenome]